MRKLLNFLLLGVLWLFTLSGYSQTTPSPFPYYESFTFSTAKDIKFGGAPTAFLTAIKLSEGEGKGFLRLTENVQNQKGYIYNQTDFPSNEGLSIEFEYFTYGSTNADGICFFLFDAAATFSIGGFGGSLGYAPYNGQGETSNGLSKGYLGVGFDEYGNFATTTEGRNGGNGTVPLSNAVTLRGSAATNYPFLKSVRTEHDIPGDAFSVESQASQRITDTTDNRYRKAFIDLKPRSGGGYFITVSIKRGNNPKRVVIDNFEYTEVAPTALRYGFAGSTGNSYNTHEIRNIRINDYTANPQVPPTAVDDGSDAVPLGAYADTEVEYKILDNDYAHPSKTKDLSSVVIVTQPANSASTIVPTSSGTIKYKPKPGFTGTDQFIYYFKDNEGFPSNPATVYLKVNPRPVGSRDSVYTVVNRAVTFDVTKNDLDKPDGINTKIETVAFPKLAKQPTFLSPTGILTYKPELDKWGYDTLKYVIRNKDGIASDPILVRIKINSPPVANDDYYSIQVNKTNSDQLGEFQILLNDKDEENELDSVSIVTIANPKDGNSGLGIKKDGKNTSLLFRPQLNVIGPAEVHYKVYDKDGEISNLGKVFFTIHPDPIIGLAKKVIKTEEAPNNSFNVTFKFTVKNHATVPLSKVQVTDDLISVFTGTTFNVNSASIKTTGTLVRNPAFDGKSIKDLLDANASSLAAGQTETIEFMANIRRPANYNVASPYQNTAVAKGTFISTGKEVSDVSTEGDVPDIGIVDRPWVSGTPTPVHLPDPVKPTATPFTKTIYVDSPPILIDLLDGDTAGSPKTIDRATIAISQPATGNGSAVIEPTKNHQVTYTLTPNFVGTAKFKYLVKDSYGVASDSAEVTIVIKAKPVGVDDNVPFINKDKSLTVPFNVRANDGPDGLVANSVLFKDALNGTAGIDNSGNLSYTPKTGYFGPDEVYYTLQTSDGGVSAPIKVNLVVNDPPTARDTNITVAVGVPAQIDLVSLTADKDGTVNNQKVVASSGTWGQPVHIGNGVHRYVQFAGGSSGTDQFTYTIEDNRGVVSNIGTVYITISSTPNNPPVGKDERYTVVINSPGITIDIPALCTDPDGNNTLVKNSVVVQPVSKGSLLPQGNGIYKYVPNAGTTGTDNFTYTIQDNKGATSVSKTITIVIQAEPSPRIGLAKAVKSIANSLNGTYDVTYLFTLQNMGGKGLKNISLKDDLGLTFPGTQFIVRQPISVSGTLVANNNFNGLGSIELLDPSSIINANATETVELTVNVKLISREGVFLNTAFAKGISDVNGDISEDQSTVGTKPDPFIPGDVTPKDPTLVELLFPKLFIPEGFSPNNDGTNDVFVIRNTNNQKIAIEIFNRWGNRVFKSTDYQNNWDGKCFEKLCLGQDLPTGTYYYIILLGGADKYTGYITLNR